MSREVARVNQQELDQGVPDSASWHQDFRDTAWVSALRKITHSTNVAGAQVFVGNLSPELVEGDVLCVFSQFGEIDDLVFPRDDKSGKPKGFCFIKFEDWRSTVLTVDNFNNAELLERALKVDHHRPLERVNAKTNKTVEQRLSEAQAGSSFRDVEGPYSFDAGVNLFARNEASSSGAGDWRAEREAAEKKRRKAEKKEKKKAKKHRSADNSA